MKLENVLDNKLNKLIFKEIEIKLFIIIDFGIVDVIINESFFLRF